jgi:hypothetical protein
MRDCDMRRLFNAPFGALNAIIHYFCTFAMH